MYYYIVDSGFRQPLFYERIIFLEEIDIHKTIVVSMKKGNEL